MFSLLLSFELENLLFLLVLKHFLLVLGGQTVLVGLREVDRSMSLQVS